MGRVETEAFRFGCPTWEDQLVRRQALEHFETATEVGAGDEVRDMTSELLVVIVIEALDGRVLDGPAHSLDAEKRSTVRVWRNMLAISA